MDSFFKTNCLHFPRNKNITSGRYRISCGKMYGYHLQKLVFVWMKKHDWTKDGLLLLWWAYNNKPLLAVV